MPDANEILFEEIPGLDGNLGLVTLNRPQALNALTHAMCLALDAQLAQWSSSPLIKAVIIRGTGDKAFCAGGDIRQIYTAGKMGNTASACQFFWDEYRLNHRIFHFPKPYIALLDGITMGGGVGISIHGSHRVASERFLFAMPETGIGYFPDVGGSYFLPRCPGKTGYYLGLTGARLHAADALYLHLVDYMIPHERFAELISVIAETRFNDKPHQVVSSVLQQFALSDQLSTITSYQDLIETYFALDSFEKIYTALANDPNPWCKEQYTILSQKSPTSLFITLKALQIGAQQHFDACMQLEYQLAYHFLQGHDFYEGIRAVLIDKDQKPQWHPKTIDSVSLVDVDHYFSNPADKPLTFNL